MSKYICLCGNTYKTKEMAKIHMQMYEDLELIQGYQSHKIFKQHWHARFATWFWNFHWPRFMRFVGGYLIYFVIIHHFHIDWSWWEATLIGAGMGLYIE